MVESPLSAPHDVRPKLKTRHSELGASITLPA